MVLAESKNRVGLGRALMNSRGGAPRQSQRGGGGRGGGRGRGKGPVEAVFKPEKKEAEWYKIRSITEQTDLDDFLATAELGDADFTAKRLDVQVVHKDQYNPYLLTADQEKTTLKKQKEHTRHLTVPRRPAWDEHTTPVELDRLERDSFLNWRRGLAELQETNDLLMTPFERNLEVWRQLWRVLERSDLVVQIVDARNPLLFRSQDLEKYVQQVDPRKKNLLLVNKADMMTTEQRRAWADYFDKERVRYKFFSAALAKQINDAELESDFEDVDEEELLEDDSLDDGKIEDEDEEEGGALVETNNALVTDTGNLELKEDDGEEEAEKFAVEEDEDPRVKIITVDELEGLFLENAPDIDDSDSETPHKTTIGLVGYPNVGKSSTINALMGAKKVSVSATPGKTKHFQTLHLSDRIMLCDCPGLVFPNFANTKAELVCNGILPIDQQREFTGPAALVAQRIPKSFMESLYGIKIRTRPLEEGGTGIPAGEELLVAYARARGFMKTSAGNPDDSRAARYILKDYVNGKLLFCHPPPADPPIDPLWFNRELYDDAHLPENRRFASAGLSPSLEATDGASEMGSMDDMISFIPEGSKTAALDKQYFDRRVGTRGHMKNPFQRGPTVTPQTLEGGKVLSGRKAKTMLALENNLSPEEVRELMGGKKHFKKGGGKKKKKAAEDDI